MRSGPNTILKDMRKCKQMKCRPIKHNSIETAEKKDKIKKIKTCMYKYNNYWNNMSQKSSKNLRTLSKHMTNDTKLQLDQIQ